MFTVIYRGSVNIALTGSIYHNSDLEFWNIVHLHHCASLLYYHITFTIGNR